jgi:arylsulfatase A-like enzyme
MKLIISLALLLLSSALGAAEPRPNIVFIMADDLGWGETGCYGQQKIRTPNIDKLAAQGTRFTRAYSGAPVCAPSRCVLMTGLQLARAPIRGNKQAVPGQEGQFPLAASYATWVQAIEKAGYATCGVGKWGLGMPDNEGSPLKHGFRHFFGYYCQAKAHTYYPAYLWSDDRKVMLDNGPEGVPGHGKGDDFAKFQGKDYAPDHLVAEAKLWLEQRAKDGKPFVLYLPFTEPHVALQPPQRIVETYPKEWDPKPYLGDKGYVSHPRPHAAYAAMITSLDEHVGQVMQWLDAHKMTDNTIIVFTSDNGATHDVGGVDTGFFNSVAGLRGLKGSLHEGGMRVPFIVRWPGHTPAGAACDEIVAFPDMLPTLCDLLGIAAPKCDGTSVRALFEGKPPAAPHPPLTYDFPEYGGQQAVIDGKWKLIRTELRKAGPNKLPAWELYDLAADRNETTDLAAQKPDEVKRLDAIFQSQLTPNTDYPMYPPPKKAKAKK